MNAIMSDVVRGQTPSGGTSARGASGVWCALWYAAFVTMRLLVVAFFFVTSVYSVLNYSPFVFQQFIRPRIFWWVNQFVATHHLWYCGAYALSVLTLLPELLRSSSTPARSRTVRRLS